MWRWSEWLEKAFGSGVAVNDYMVYSIELCEKPPKHKETNMIQRTMEKPVSRYTDFTEGYSAEFDRQTRTFRLVNSKTNLTILTMSEQAAFDLVSAIEYLIKPYNKCEVCDCDAPIVEQPCEGCATN